MNNIVVFIICLVIVFGIGSSGTFITRKVVKSEWYECIKSSVTPPSYVFPIVWNILFMLISIALYFNVIDVLKQRKEQKVVNYTILILFAINLIANGLWTFIFFSMKATAIALLDLVVVLITAIFLMIKSNDPRTKWLILPYVLWLCFAGWLNFSAWKKSEVCT